MTRRGRGVVSDAMRRGACSTNTFGNLFGDHHGSQRVVIAEAGRLGALSVLAFREGDESERRNGKASGCMARARIAIRGRTDDGAHRTSRCTDDEDVCHLVFH